MYLPVFYIMKEKDFHQLKKTINTPNMIKNIETLVRVNKIETEIQNLLSDIDQIDMFSANHSEKNEESYIQQHDCFDVSPIDNDIARLTITKDKLLCIQDRQLNTLTNYIETIKTANNNKELIDVLEKNTLFNYLEMCQILKEKVDRYPIYILIDNDYDIEIKAHTNLFDINNLNDFDLDKNNETNYILFKKIQGTYHT